MRPVTDEYPCHRIAAELRTRVFSGEWKPGQRIQTEIELASSFGVCRATMKKALRQLELEGLLWGRRGKGRFVCDPSQRPRTRCVGVVTLDMKDIVNSATAQIMAGMHQALEAGGYHLAAYARNASAAGVTRESSARLWFGLVDIDAIDGAVIMTREVDQQSVLELSHHMPVVWIGHPSVKRNLLGVRMDFLSGAFEVVRHLIDLGHTHLALMTIGGEYAMGREQRDGARLAVRQLLGQRGRLTVLEGKRYVVAEGARLAHQLLVMTPRPTALICGSDEMAMGAWSVLQDAGVRVPEDLSVTGWNDTITTEQLPIAMTSVRVDYRQAGATAAARLLAALDPERHDAPADEPLPTRLIIRSSTSRPRR